MKQYLFTPIAGNDMQAVATILAHIALDSEVGDCVLVVGMYDARKQDQTNGVMPRHSML